MRVLVIGSGAREHALVAALAADPGVTHVACAPGNPGIGRSAELHAVVATSPGEVAALARRVRADLVVIGPEAPLVAGVADAVRETGIACFGPSIQGAQLEGSKDFAKQVMSAAGVATAGSRTCSSSADAEIALDEFGAPYVVKDDGLAAGKGVVVTDDRDEALAHAIACERVVIEEYLAGPEVSLFVVTDGTHAVPLQPAQDFKRIFDGDQGPNTGGMGAYTPLPWAPDDLVESVMSGVVHPTLAEMRRRGTPFAGLLYCGLILTEQGVKVIEFNARFGDPETEAVLALLETPLGGLLHAAATGTLAEHPPLEWREGAAVTVVLASKGYPEAPRTGDPIEGADGDPDAPFAPGLLHAGTTQREDGVLVTSGGRVLAATATGANLAEARAHVYALARSVAFDGAQYRSDIAEAASAT